MTVPVGRAGGGGSRVVRAVAVVVVVCCGAFSGAFSSGGIADGVARVRLGGLVRGLVHGGRIGVAGAGGRDGRLHVGRVHSDRLRRRVG